MSKRKTMDGMDGNIESCKRMRDEIFYNNNNKSEHEKQHLLSINRQLSEFVTNSIGTMEFQKEEISRLNDSLRRLSVALANSESKNNIDFTNDYVF